ncbi:MAG: hypothetical protein M3209_00215 [Acidobacteriota bacterium]|nr:hypothetical protein [Acidobacteriota bacterium]
MEDDKQIPTDEWLEQINEEFRKRDVSHKQRPLEAIFEWAKYAGTSISLGDEDAKKIFEWFEKNTKAGSQNIGSMYVGVLYYDSCFWAIYIHVAFGIRVRVDAADSLKTMPETIKSRLLKDKQEFIRYASVWADCLDYGFGIEEVIEDKVISIFGQELFSSGNQQLKATVSLLLENNPNSKAMESARMATEMFLKAFLASKVGLTEKQAKEKIGHGLEKALNMCLDIDKNSELQLIQPDLSVFPEIGDRYKGTNKTLLELWIGYAIAQFTGATVIRSLTGRDVRKTMRIS